jgi:hypothetical protein
LFDQDLWSLGKHTQNKNNASFNAPTTYGWLTLYSFICLMILPSVMENYGPITNVWDGGYVGEKFSQELKPWLKGGMTGNWNINLLSNILKQDAMSRIELPTSTQVDKRNAQREYHYTRYKHALDVITQYNHREPISVVFFRDGGCGAVLDNGTDMLRYHWNPKQL